MSPNAALSRDVGGEEKDVFLSDKTRQDTFKCNTPVDVLLVIWIVFLLLLAHI